MKLKPPACLLALFFGAKVCLADHFTLNVGTTVPGNWTVSSGRISNVPPFIYYNNPYGVFGLSVTSTGNGDGRYLPGTNLSAFDAFWTAQTLFFPVRRTCFSTGMRLPISFREVTG